MNQFFARLFSRKTRNQTKTTVVETHIIEIQREEAPVSATKETTVAADISEGACVRARQWKKQWRWSTDEQAFHAEGVRASDIRRVRADESHRPIPVDSRTPDLPHLCLPATDEHILPKCGLE